MVQEIQKLGEKGNSKSREVRQRWSIGNKLSGRSYGP